MKTEEAKQLLHKELNVLLKSIEEVDANAYVLMVDSHSRGDNICRSMLETSSVKLDLISGYPRPNYMMTGIDNSFDGSCLWVTTQKLVAGVPWITLTPHPPFTRSH